jgi:hypothetical protein
MNTRRIFLILILTAVFLAACGGNAPAPTAEVAERPTEQPTVEATAVPTPEPLAPIEVVEQYHAALDAGDLEAVVALLSEDVRWRGTPHLTGKSSVVSFLESTIDDEEWVDEISNLRAIRNRVTYTIASYRNEVLQASGEETIIVENGLITVIESYATLGTDTRPDIVEYTFTASAAGYSGPDEISGGWVKITITNEGQEPYHIQLVRLETGKSLEDLKAALTADPATYPAWAEPFGGPNAPDPGGTTSAIAYLPAGNYAMIDIIPNAEGIPHYQNGLMRALTVTEPGGIIPGEPLPDVTITLNDFKFETTVTPLAENQTIRLVNNGTQVHEAVLVRLEDGKTADDYLNTPPGEIPPAVSLGGITGIVPGDSQYLQLDFEPGTYALYCFLMDAESQAPHFVLGMIQEFTVE